MESSAKDKKHCLASLAPPELKTTFFSTLYAA